LEEVLEREEARPLNAETVKNGAAAREKVGVEDSAD
jgi:hypothetical protein